MESVAVLDDAALKAYLKKTEDKLKSPHQLLATAYATRGFRDIMDHFNKEEGPTGPWQELSPARLRQRGPNAKILQDTGNLRQNITPTNYRKERDAIRVFDAAPYSGQHNSGLPSRNLPKRTFMWLSREALKDMAKIVVGLLAGGQ